MSTTLSLARDLGVDHERVHDVLTEVLVTTPFPYGFQPPQEPEDERELVLPRSIEVLAHSIISNEQVEEPTWTLVRSFERRSVTIQVDGLPTIYDDRYVSEPLPVEQIIVRGQRPSVNDPWDLRDIEVSNELAADGRPRRRAFQAGTGMVYSIGDAPEWLLSVARQALGS